MKKIKLTKGKYAVVDDEDYLYLNRFKWYAHKVNTLFFAYRAFTGLKGKKAFLKMENFIVYCPVQKGIAHCNRDNLDCRKSNLKIVSWSDTRHKKTRVSCKNRTSKYQGVSFNNRMKNNKWRVQIQKNYKQYNLGYYKTENKAALAYNEKAKELYGNFACLNKVT